jgi:hypothetical protein
LQGAFFGQLPYFAFDEIVGQTMLCSIECKTGADFLAFAAKTHELYIPVSELNAYTAKAVRYHTVDQQVRSVDLGKTQIGIGMVTRGKLLPGTSRKGVVAEHDQVSEVYHIIKGPATLLTGPELVNSVKRITRKPLCCKHWFTEIPAHITYMMVRIDPDKVVPTKSRAESEADLKVVPNSGRSGRQ